MELIVLPNIMLRLPGVDRGLSLTVELVVERDGLVDVLRMVSCDRSLLVPSPPVTSPAECIEAVRRYHSIEIRITREKSDRILPIRI